MKTKLFLIALMTFIMGNLNAQNSDKSKILIAYYSWSGNTRAMAQQIQKATGTDVFEIVPQKAYTSDYKECCDIAKKEINDGVRPALKGKLPDMSGYDILIIGSPCWWATVAPPVMTFLESYDLSGKTVLPFMTHGGSGMGRSEQDIKKMCPKSTVLKGLPIYGSSAKNCSKEIEKWLKEVL